MLIKFYLANLSPAVTEDEIHELFASYGQITQLRLLGNRHLNDQPWCGAYVWLETEYPESDILEYFNTYRFEDERRLAISPAGPPKKLEPHTKQQRQLAEEIARQINESEKKPYFQILDIVRLCGDAFARRILDETLEIEAGEGMLVEDGTRRRTAGGVFFKLAKNRMSPRMLWFIFKPAQEEAAAESAEKPSRPRKTGKPAKPPRPSYTPPAYALPPLSEPEEIKPEHSAEEVAAARQELDGLRQAHQDAQQRLEALKRGTIREQAGLFSAMKQVVELQRQIDALLKEYPDLR